MTAPYLVTGATGYIGGRLIPKLVEAGHQVRVWQQGADGLGAVQQLDHARPVVGQRRLHEFTTGEGAEVDARGLGQRRLDEIAVVDSRQRPYAVGTLLLAERGHVRKFHIAPRLDLLVDVLLVVAVVDVIEDPCTVGLLRTQSAMIEVERAIGATP